MGDVPKPPLLIMFDLEEWLCINKRSACAYGGLARLLWYIIEGDGRIDAGVFMTVNRHYQVYYNELREIVSSGDCITLTPNADRLSSLHTFLLESTIATREDCCKSDDMDESMEVNS